MAVVLTVAKYASQAEEDLQRKRERHEELRRRIEEVGLEGVSVEEIERALRPDNEAIERVRQDAMEELEEQYLLGPLEPVHPSIQIGSSVYQIIKDLWEMLRGDSIPDVVPINRVGIVLSPALAERWR
ncbi:MAG: hypothetical protein KatS3mg015_2183 [Fimbriimonadales bacterium]|nr:MAG: hypothetical protein KatS3mg015_2183 [Fimbriimonadales bacterium]